VARRTMLSAKFSSSPWTAFAPPKRASSSPPLGMSSDRFLSSSSSTIGMTGKAYILDLIQKFGTNSVEVE